MPPSSPFKHIQHVCVCTCADREKERETAGYKKKKNSLDELGSVCVDRSRRRGVLTLTNFDNSLTLPEGLTRRLNQVLPCSSICRKHSYPVLSLWVRLSSFYSLSQSLSFTLIYTLSSICVLQRERERERESSRKIENVWQTYKEVQISSEPVQISDEQRCPRRSWACFISSHMFLTLSRRCLSYFCRTVDIWIQLEPNCFKCSENLVWITNILRQQEPLHSSP